MSEVQFPVVSFLLLMYVNNIEFVGKSIAQRCDFLFLVRPDGDNTPANALDALNMVSP